MLKAFLFSFDFLRFRFIFLINFFAVLLAIITVQTSSGYYTTFLFLFNKTSKCLYFYN